MRIIEQDLIGTAKNIYLIGIGGVGMSALARVLKHRGLNVSGSDSKSSVQTAALCQEGIDVFIGQATSQVMNADIVIYSSAIRENHVEMLAAREQGCRIFHRAEVLSSLFNAANTSIAVTGTHGKTTTSSLISYLLTALDKDPTCLVGGNVMNFGTNTLLGNPDFFVSEVDESDGTHEMYAPNYSVITNLEEDHLDHYSNLDALTKSFAKFMGNTKNPGLIIYNGDDLVLENLVKDSGKPKVSFGFAKKCDFSAQNVVHTSFGSEFELFEAGFFVARLKLSVPGRHNILNALAAVTTLIQLGISPEEIAPFLAEFKGAGRRLEVKWESSELLIVDDYAHHPTEVRAVIDALREQSRHLTVVFQPHRYSRIEHFFKDFGKALELADEIVLMPIYSAGESNPNNINSGLIYEQVLAAGHQNVTMVERQNVLEHLIDHKHLEGIVAFLGAGDIGEIADGFTDRYKSIAQNRC